MFFERDKKVILDFFDFLKWLTKRTYKYPVIVSVMIHCDMIWFYHCVVLSILAVYSCMPLVTCHSCVHAFVLFIYVLFLLFMSRHNETELNWTETERRSCWGLDMGLMKKQKQKNREEWKWKKKQRRMQRRKGKGKGEKGEKIAKTHDAHVHIFTGVHIYISACARTRTHSWL